MSHGAYKKLPREGHNYQCCIQGLSLRTVCQFRRSWNQEVNMKTMSNQ